MSLFDSASLVVTPNGIKEDKLYSIKPTDGSGDLVVTRATTATRVNENGFIEVTPYNLFTYSEQFDNASWVKERITITTNATTAPNGTLTADKIVEDTTTNSHRVRQNSTSEQGIQYTLSYYLKASERTKARINVGGLNAFAFFDLSNGTIIGTPTLCTALIIDANNGWYRCSITYTQTSATSTAQLHLAAPLNAAGDFSYLGDGVSGIFVWGAQLVTGSSAKEYFPTTDRLDVPRLDYTNSSCPSILVEPQRTNLLLRSEEFDNASWTKTASSITANNTISPDGNTTADKLVEDTATANHLITQAAGGAGVQTYSISVFAKSFSENRYLQIWVGNTINAAAWIRLDLDNGTITQNNGIAGTGYSIASSSIQDFGNGWYKCVLVANKLNTTGTNTIQFRLSQISTGAENNSYLGDGTSGIYLWGAQLEVGSYATSYVPTVASSVTRNADVISKTGISSLIGQTEGTLFVEISASQLGSGFARFNISDGTANNWVFLGKNLNKLRGFVRSNNVTIFDNDSTILSDGFIKCAIAYKSTECALFINGLLISSNTTAFSFTSALNSLHTGNQSVNPNTESALFKSVILFKERLTNAELAQLTTI